MEIEVEVATPEVAEVLAKVPKSPGTMRPNPTPTKETVKDKKGKQPAILVRTSLRRNTPNPIAQEKGKAINLEPEEEDIKNIPMDDEDVGKKVEEVEAQGVGPIMKFPEYVSLCKPKSKVLKDIDESKTPLKTPLLLDEIVFDSPHLA